GVDLAGRHHLAELFSRDAIRVLEPGPHRQLAVGELLNLHRVDAPSGGGLVEDRPDLAERTPGNGGGVGNGLEVSGQLLTGFDTSGHSGGRDAGSVTEPVRGAQHRLAGGRHDRRDALSGVTETTELALCVVDRSEPAEALEK